MVWTSEYAEKLSKGIEELEKGNAKKAYNLFKDVYEHRLNGYTKQVQDRPKSSTLILDALNVLHSLVWLRVAEAEKNATKISDSRKKQIICERIAEAYAKTSELAKLQQWIESLQEDKERIFSYFGAVEGLIGKKKH